MKKIVFAILTIVITSVSGYSQKAGGRLYTGLSFHHNKDEGVTPKGYHVGYLGGLDARLTDNNTSFLVGVQYANIAIEPSDGIAFFRSEDNVHYLKGRIGFDSYFFSYNDYTKLRAKVLGTYYKVLDYDKPRLVAVGNGKIQEGMTGLVLGVGADFSWITVDLEYEIGLSDAYPAEGSKFNGLMLMIGGHF